MVKPWRQWWVNRTGIFTVPTIIDSIKDQLFMQADVDPTALGEVVNQQVKTMWAAFKTLVGYLIWWIILPNYMGIIISQYEDPYKPISIMECHKGFERCSDGGIFQICALFSPGTLGKISPHFDLRIFFSKGLVQPPGLVFVGYMIYTYNIYIYMSPQELMKEAGFVWWILLWTTQIFKSSASSG